MTHSGCVAFYARVSSQTQVKDATIESQLVQLEARVAHDGEIVADEHRFIDDGYSGAQLVRPALERLRDSAAGGLLDRLYIHSPDRLSRKYAYQALLLEEFAAQGVEVVFLNHSNGETPEDNLLLQVQGMIAEYERAKIIERQRRGKLHRARNGSVNVLSGAPYGYDYVRKQLDGTPAHYRINFAEARVAQRIFTWIGVDRLTLGEVIKRLEQEEIPTRTGKRRWDRSVIWLMLQNPAYKGKAAYGKTKTVARKAQLRPQRHSSEQPKRGYSCERVSAENWIVITVPALVSESLYDSVQEQLEENRKQARQRRRGARYLLQGLIVCGHCHYAYYGKPVSRKATKGRTVHYSYYRCIGSDGYRFAGERICDNKQVRTDELDNLVWVQVSALLRHPERLSKEYQRRLDELEKTDAQAHDTAALTAQANKLKKGISRLIDTYAEGYLDKEEFEPKIKQLKTKLLQIETQIEACQQQTSKQMELCLIVNQIEQFSGTVKTNLDNLEFHEKRDLIRALVKRIEIYKDEIIVVFRVDPASEPPPSERNNGGDQANSLLGCCRSDYTTLRGSLIPHLDTPVFHHHRRC